MKQLLTAFVTVGLLASAGCKKKDDKAAPDPAAKTTTGSATPAAAPAAGPAAAPAAGGGADCDPKAYKDKAGVYCVVLPEGYAMDEKNSKMEYNVQTDWFINDGHSFIIKVYKNDGSSTFDGLKNDETFVNEDLKLSKSEAIADGKGWYTERANAKEKRSETNAAVQSKDYLITCETSEDSDVVFKPADACKTLRSMK